jgi:hypothetical protein
MEKARGAVRHHALTLGGADCGAEIGLARQTGRTFPAFRGVERNDMVAFFHRGDARADVNYDARAFVAQNGRKQSLGIGAGASELISVTDPTGLDLDKHFPGTRTFELDVGNNEWLARIECHSCLHFHSRFPIYNAAKTQARDDLASTICLAGYIHCSSQLPQCSYCGSNPISRATLPHVSY